MSIRSRLIFMQVTHLLGGADRMQFGVNEGKECLLVAQSPDDVEFNLA